MLLFYAHSNCHAHKPDQFITFIFPLLELVLTLPEHTVLLKEPVWYMQKYHESNFHYEVTPVSVLTIVSLFIYFSEALKMFGKEEFGF